MAAIAGKTQRMLLGSAVTVLSTDDPVRVFQRFSTLDAVSNGRAEVILGRGSFTESYPLFGYDLVAIQRALRRETRSLRQAPRSEAGHLVGAHAQQPDESDRLSASRERAAAHMDRRRRQPRVGCPRSEARPSTDTRDHWRKRDAVHALRRVVPHTLSRLGKPLLPIGVHSPGHVAVTDEEAREELWPHYAAMMNRIGRERGWPPRGRDDFDREAGPGGALYVGAPETVAAKIVETVKASWPVTIRSQIQQRHTTARRTDEEH